MRHPTRTRIPLLFAERATAHDVVEAQRRGLDKALAELPSEVLLRQSLDDLVTGLVEQFRIDVPVLNRDGIVEFPPQEVDVLRDPTRFFTMNGPHHVKGTRLSIGIPFSGDQALFRYPESSFAGPIEGEVDKENQYVVLTHDAEDPDRQAVRREFESRIERISHALSMTRGRTSEWNERLPDVIRTRLTQRRAKLEKDQNLSLGYVSAPPPAAREQSAGPKTAATVFGQGQQFDALREFQRIVAQATDSIVVIDNYVDPTVLDSLSGKRPNVEVRMLTKSVSGPLTAAAKAFNVQHGQRGRLSIRSSDVFHDRFVIIDGRHFYHFGASIKDAGRRVFRLAKIDNPSEQQALKQQFDAAWAAAKVIM